jgi:hypothetical protein
MYVAHGKFPVLQAIKKSPEMNQTRRTCMLISIFSAVFYRAT